VCTVEEYRAYADECFDWARTARTEKDRHIFLQMADTWLEAAARASVKAQLANPVPCTNDALQIAK